MSVFADGHVYLDGPTTLLDAFAELVAGRFRGTVSAWPGTDAMDWSMEVHDAADNLTKAILGDHLVLTYGRLLTLSDAEYRSL